MMKFKGDPKPKRDVDWKESPRIRWSARMIPTVDEVEDVISFMTADTILQILRGQGLYFGYECERHVDNSIPVTSTGAYDRYLEVLDKKRARVNTEREIRRHEKELIIQFKPAIKIIAKRRKISIKEASAIFLNELDK